MHKQPNILLLMADQLTVDALSFYGNKVCKTPRLDAFVDQSTLFDSAYCGSPICGPSRYALLTGMLPSRVGSYDNAAELPAATPTLPHYLRAAGYQTCLSGKMHFVGPDQLHGYEERLTTDIYPSDFGWTTNWRHVGRLSTPTGLNMRNIIESGVCVRSMQLDYDDDVANQGVQKLYDLARDDSGKPFFLTVSLTHPHNPFVCEQSYFDLYKDADIDLPKVPMLAREQQDDHSRRLHEFYRRDEYEITTRDIVRTRRAYYGMVSYVDHQLGRVLDALKATGQDQNTVVIFTTDHGEMLGERGLWYKFNFFEASVRVPLAIRLPGECAGRRISDHVSHVDLLPTLLSLAGNGKAPDLVAPIDGLDLLGHWGGTPPSQERPVYSEYCSEGSIAPLVMVRKGRHKAVICEKDRPQLYNLDSDPFELENVWDSPANTAARQSLMDDTNATWDLNAFREQVLQSQATRRFLHKVLTSGKQTHWDFQPNKDASTQYVRSGGSPTIVKGKARYPYVDPIPPQYPRSEK